jgi:hypothetical protein
MDDLPPEIAAWLEQARRADEPSEVDQARVGRTLARSLGLAPVGWTAAEASAKTAPGGGAATQAIGTASVGPVLKAALVAAIVATGAGAVFMWRGDAPAASPRAQSAQRSPVSAAARPETAPAPHVGEPTRVVQAQPSADRSTVSPESRPSEAATRSPIQSDALDMPTAPRVIRSTVKPSVDGRSLLPPKAAARGAWPPTSGVRGSQTTQPGNSLLEEELSLIAAASQALDGGDARAALRRLENHRSRFGAGFLTEEREGLWVVALCQAGRMPEAASARDEFERRAPRSPLRRRIATQCDR